MPVPVSVTGWASKAGSAASVDERAVAISGSVSFTGNGAGSGGAPPAAAAGANGSGAAAAPARAPAEAEHAPVSIRNLSFSYPDIDGSPLVGVEPLIQDMSMTLERGSRCLLLGPNGAGKTTLLRILGGKHMVPKDSVQVLGRPVFHDTSLVCSGRLSYIGGNWQRDVAFAGYAVPLQGDFPASKMLDSIPGVDPARKARIVEVLDIDLEWRMHQVSDGQRRRVQLAYGLLKEFDVLLLDEITVDLDVLGRRELMDFLKSECETRGATVVYVTHIFDGLEDWASHIAFVAKGRLQVCAPVGEVPELAAGGGLLELMEKWLRADKKEKEEKEEREGRPMQKRVAQARNSGWAAGRTASSLAGGASITQIKDSSNAVLRC